MNYYKILNESEKHNEMQYKTGINRDVKHGAEITAYALECAASNGHTEIVKYLKNKRGEK